MKCDTQVWWMRARWRHAISSNIITRELVGVHVMIKLNVYIHITLSRILARHISGRGEEAETKDDINTEPCNRLQVKRGTVKWNWEVLDEYVWARWEHSRAQGQWRQQSISKCYCLWSRHISLLLRSLFCDRKWPRCVQCPSMSLCPQQSWPGSIININNSFMLLMLNILI